MIYRVFNFLFDLVLNFYSIAYSFSYYNDDLTNSIEHARPYRSGFRVRLPLRLIMFIILFELCLRSIVICRSLNRCIAYLALEILLVVIL